MRRNLMTAAGTIAAAFALSVSMSGSAYATVGTAGCGTTGAYGDMYFSNYHGPAATINIKFSLSDTLADGNSVRLRLVSQDVSGIIRYWSWRTNSQGSGTTSRWETTAADSRGLHKIGLEVARFNSNGTYRNGCFDWAY
ncbi:hypothetical protein [Streptomyces sp. NPDC093600]|uniref:hypothetical protein n=1 Tax=Streptomyces sp. NPDC093600 TaxID=3366047 RepID=UPI00382413AB